MDNAIITTRPAAQAFYAPGWDDEAASRLADGKVVRLAWLVAVALRYYRLIVAVFVTVMVGLLVLPYAWWAVFWIAAYWLYYGIKVLLYSQPPSYSRFFQRLWKWRELSWFIFARS